MIHFFLIFSDWALLFLRVILGALLIIHGLSKLRRRKKMAKDMPVALMETVSGAAFIVGFLTQFFAALIFIEFIVILLTAKRKIRFTELETNFLILASAAVLATSGSGLYSLEGILKFVLY